MNNNKQLQEMVAALSREFGIDSLPDENREVLVEKIADSLAKRIFLMTFERLGEQSSKEYEALVGSDASDEDVREFLLSKIPDYDQLVKNEVEQLKGLMKAAQEG